MNAERLRAQVAALQRAVDRLSRSLAEPKDEYKRDSAIKRFEFTFELAWKAMKTYVELQGLEVRTPREAIRAAFKAGLIPDDSGWFQMIELRNLTTHTYDEAVAERIFAQLPGMLDRFKALLRQLQSAPRSADTES